MGIFSTILGGGRVSAGSFPPSGTSNPETWFTDLFGGLITNTGIRVSIADAMTVPGIAAAVQVLSDDLAKVPIHLYRRKTGGGSELATDHPLYSRLSGWPAPWLSSFMWRKTLIASALTHGNGYSRVRWSGEGVIQRITAVKPGSATTRWAADGEPFYDLTGGSNERGLSWRDVLHVPYRPSTSLAMNGGAVGISPIAQHREHIALCIATERFSGSFFRNGARPSVVIEAPLAIKEENTVKRLRAQLEQVYSGVDNAGKIAILELGMKMKEISFSNTDAQLTEVRRQQAIVNAQLFGVPPHKIGILDNATYRNVENLGIDYVTGPLSSLAEGLEAAIETTCLSEAEREQYFVEADMDGLKRGDMLSRFQSYAIGRQWGWLSADDIRDWEHQNPLPNGDGTTYLTPLNMIPAGDNPAKPDPADQKDPPTKN